MRHWKVRLYLLLLGTVIVLLWPFLVLFFVASALITREDSPREVWREIRVQTVEMLTDWLRMWRDPTGAATHG